MASETLCASCGRPAPPGATFCGGCGTSLTEMPAGMAETMVAASGESLTNCPSCGGRMQPGDQFCQACGAIRPMSGSTGGLSSVWDAIQARLVQATQGEFEVIGEIGRGAMGSVYLANDVELGRRVAIKVVAPQLLADDNMVERFRLEARTVASLRHPHIVAIHAVKTRDDLHYFIMAFVEGCSLRDIVKTHGPLPIPIIQALIFQVGGALAYAHRSGGGVIHRDVKPANIMIDTEGNAFLTDFGISKVAEGSGLTLTGTGLIIGTPEYMSPEQCMGESPTGAGDQYSLGVVAYEMICGKAPFTGTQYSVLLSHGSKEPEPIGDLRPDCPDEVGEAVMRMLAKSPADRWPNLDEAVVGLGGKPLGHDDPLRTEIVALMPEIVEPKPAPDSSASIDRPSIGSDAPTAVYVAKLPEWLAPGETYDLRAHAETAGGSKLPESEIEWSTSDPSIATVEDGRVIAHAPGVVTILATAGGVETSLTLGVSAPGPAEIVIEPNPVQVEPGKKVTLRATVQDKSGNPIEYDLVWSCSGAEVATVSNKGQVRAHSFGTATVTAEAGDVRATVEVTVQARGKAMVTAAPVFKIAQAVAQKTGSQGGWRRPAALGAAVLVAITVVLGVRGQLPFDLFSGQGPDESGDLTAEVLPLADRGDQGAEASSVAAVIVTMDPARNVIQPGDTVTLASSAMNAEGDPVPVGSVTWSVDDSSIATVNNQGLVTARGEGRTLVYAAAGASTGSVEFFVSPPPTVAGTPMEVVAVVTPGAGQGPTEPVTPPPPPAPPPAVAVSISLILETEMTEQASQDLEVRIVDDRGRAMTNVNGVSIQSTNLSVLSVSGNRVTAVGPGSGFVVASVGALSDRVQITVEAIVAAVEIQGGDLTLPMDSSTVLSARVLGSSRTPLTGRVVSWESSNPQVATVNATTGRATATGPGRAVIVASSDDVSDRVTVTVAARVEVAAVEIQGGDITFEAGATTPLTATVRSSSNQLLADRSVSWRSLNPTVAAVDPSTGLATANAPGEAVIVATSEGVEGRITATVPEAAITNAAISLELNRYVALLSSGNEDEIRALFGSAASLSENETLLDRMGQRNFSAELVSTGSPTADQNQTTVPFQVAISFRSGFGGGQNQTGNLVATFVIGSNGWEIAAYTVVPGDGF